MSARSVRLLLKKKSKTRVGKGRSLGPLEQFGPEIDVCDNATSSEVSCMCGTKFSKLDNGESWHTGTFLGHKVVLDCCGKVFNISYRELGQRFADAKISEAAENPVEHQFFISHMSTQLQKALDRLSQTKEDVAKALILAQALEKS